MSSELSLYVLTSRMRSQTQKLDAVSVNVANASTNGFKRQNVNFETLIGGDGTKPAGQFVNDRGFHTDFTQGVITQTGNPLDMAIVGNAMFALENPNGGQQTYSRDGHFTVDQEGFLITGRGERVLDEDNAPIELPLDQKVQVNRDGSIVGEIDGFIARVGLFEFPPTASLLRVGNNQFAAAGELQPAISENSTVVSGAVEGSNIDPVLETVRMNEVSQAYQGAARLMSRIEDLQERAIRELPRASGQ